MLEHLVVVHGQPQIVRVVHQTVLGYAWHRSLTTTPLLSFPLLFFYVQRDRRPPADVRIPSSRAPLSLCAHSRVTTGGHPG